MRKILSLILILCGCSVSFPSDKADHYVLKVEDFLNYKENDFSLSEMDFLLLSTAFRLNIEGSNYSYDLNQDEEFNYCPGSVTLLPQTKNVSKVDSKYKKYGYDMIYACNKNVKSELNELDQKSHLFIIIRELNKVFSLVHIGIDDAEFEEIFLSKEGI